MAEHPSHCNRRSPKSLSSAVRQAAREVGAWLSPSPRPAASQLASHPSSHLESLENRRLLAVISGVIYGDFDLNELRGFFEDGVSDVTVFLDENENGAFDEGEASQQTDEQGRYSFSGLEQGVHYVGLALPEGYAQTTPSVNGRVPTGFDIDVVFPDDSLTPAQQDVFETAAQKWESVIVGDLPDVIGNDGTVIDDLRITATGPAIDGPGQTLGQATFTAQRSLADGGLPYQGFMEFDAADLNMLEMGQQLDETILHEMGHVLGIGTLWTGRGGFETLLTGVGSQSPQYLGENALRESQRLMNNEGPVLIETDGGPGTAYGHWDDATYFNELMTGFLNSGIENPLSRLTAAGLEDLGYEINYFAVDEYRGIGALPEDLDTAFETVLRIPYEIGLTLRSNTDSFNEANFGIRLNNDPQPFYFNAGPAIQQEGGEVRLLAEIDTSTDIEFDGDTDFRDEVVQMNFYRETNGQPGLQTGPSIGPDGDELILEDLDGTDGFELDFDTTGLAVGEHTFYARAYDRAYFTTDRATTIQIVEQQELAAKPADLRAIGTDTETILVTWNDKADNENGYLLQASTNPNFDDPAAIEDFWLPPSEGTGVVNYEYTTDTGPVSQRYFRVRAYNTGGSTAFAGRAAARTLSNGEILVDDANEEQVDNNGLTRVVAPGISTSLTHLRGTGGFADFNPGLTEPGQYFVYVRNVDIGQPGVATVEIFGPGGQVLETVEIDQAEAAGSNRLIGSFRLDDESFVRISHRSGTITADAVRFLPAD